MGQTWYIQSDERTVGPLSGRQLHAIARSGELTPDSQISLDGRSWFRAAKVLGLFSEPRAEAIARSISGNLDVETLEDAPATRLLDPTPPTDEGFRPGGEEVKTRLISSDGRDSVGIEGKTRIESFAGSIVGDDQATPSRGRAATLARAGGAFILRMGWRGFRAAVIAATLVTVWTVRSVVGLLRRRKVARTGFESKLSASLWDGPGSVRSAGPTTSKPLPEHFGRYQILRTLGKGGMGSVYLALDTQLGRQVALKVPHFSPDDGPEVLERFDREARAAAMLDHPNVCPIFDVGTIEGIPYASMAYIEGRPLADLVDADKRLVERETAVLVRKVAIAMAEAHRKGIVHRDLKPANIMINPRREPVIMDFGLASRLGVQDSKLTKDGAIVGTPSYMSPEQVGGKSDGIGPSCDIYSLGVVLYELLTSRLPFEGPVIAVLGQILSTEPAPPSVHRPDVDYQLEAICRKAMAKSTSDRFSSMADFARALTKYLKAHPQEDGIDEGEDVASWSEFFALPPRPAAGEPSSIADTTGGRRPFWALAAAVLLLAGSVGVLAMLNRGTTVQVTLSNFQVNNNTTIVNYFLDGKPIDPKELAGPIDLKTGDHNLRTVSADGREETRSFLIDKQDDQKPVNIVKRSEANPTVGTGERAYTGRRAVILMPPTISLPPLKRILLVESGQPGPKEDKKYSEASIDVIIPGGVGLRPIPGDVRRPVEVEVSQYGEEIRVPSADDFDLWWESTEGKAIRIVKNFSIKNRGIVELHIEPYLGFVRVLGKKARPPKWVVLTPVGKGNPVQVATKYGVDMIVPAGTYELWIKPAGGPVQEQLESRLEVKAGQTLEIE